MNEVIALIKAISKWLMQQFFFKFVLYSEYVLAYIQVFYGEDRWVTEYFDVSLCTSTGTSVDIIVQDVV